MNFTKYLPFLILFTFFQDSLLWAQAPNGFYVGTPCELSEANVTYYMTPLKVQVDQPLQFVEGSIHSSNNENNLYRVSLAVEKVPENTWLILKIDKSYFATCLRSKRAKKPIDQKVKRDTAIVSKGGFVIENKKDAQKIAQFLNLDIVNRKHFGHQMAGKLETPRQVFTDSDSIILKMTLTNTGTIPVKLDFGGSSPVRPYLKRFHFTVKYNGELLRKQTSGMETLLVSEYVVPPPTLFQNDKVVHYADLKNWFDFDQPGIYEVRWTYRFQLIDMRRPFVKDRSPEFRWDDQVGGVFKIEVMRN